MLKIPILLQNRLRDHVIDSNEELTQIFDDVWICDKSIAEHVDNTALNHNTILVVLLNDLNLKFKNQDFDHEMQVGDVIRFDARLPHSAIGVGTGISSFLIWDVPIELTTESLVIELEERLKELTS